MGKDLSDNQVSAMKELGLYVLRHRWRWQDRPIGARDSHAFSRWKPYASATEQVHNRRGKTYISFQFQPFTDLMGKHIKPEPFDRQLRDTFKFIDKDGTGYVVVAGLKHILTTIGRKLRVDPRN